MSYEERCVRQFKSHTKKRSDGSLLIRIESGLWDIFYGSGWENNSRFRIFKLRGEKEPRFICISGLHIPNDVRTALIKECAG